MGHCMMECLWRCLKQGGSPKGEALEYDLTTWTIDLDGVTL